MNGLTLKTESYYKICLCLGTFVYFAWKLFVHIKAPGFEPWYYRTPSLLVGIVFISLTAFRPDLNKYSKHVFFGNSILTIVEYFYLVYKYCDSYMGLFFFMGGFVLVICHIVAWRSKALMQAYGIIVAIASPILFIAVYFKTKIFLNQAFEYCACYTTAFGITWFLSYLHLINEEKFKKLETDLAQSEKSLIQSSRMASLGEVAGGVAHEINNPLQILNLSLEVLKEDRIEKNTKIIKSMEDTISRINGIVDGLKFFSGKSDQVNKYPHMVREMVDKALSVCNEKLKRNHIKTELIDDESMLTCQDVQIGQVFLSLINNSIDSIVASSNSNREIIIEIKKQIHDNSLRVSFYDSGEAIPQNIVQNIFNPFFTTKPIGQGAGLGLSISKGIVEQHDGEIEYKDNPKRFEITFKLPKQYPTMN